METIPTLYQWAGGKDIFITLAEVFYGKVLKDELLYPVFKDMSPQHPRHVGHFIAEVFGGPNSYTEDDNGSHSIMIRHHVGKMLTEQMRKRWMQLLLEAADEVGPILPGTYPLLQIPCKNQHQQNSAYNYSVPSKQLKTITL